MKQSAFHGGGAVVINDGRSIRLIIQEVEMVALNASPFQDPVSAA